MWDEDIIVPIAFFVDGRSSSRSAFRSCAALVRRWDRQARAAGAARRYERSARADRASDRRDVARGRADRRGTAVRDATDDAIVRRSAWRFRYAATTETREQRRTQRYAIERAAQAIIALGVCATVAHGGLTFGQRYVRGIEAQKKPSQPDLAPDVQDRMLRIEQAVDAIAIEVERMSEGQRFTTRLLAERFGEPARQPERSGSAGIASGEHGTNGAGGKP